MLFSSIVQVSNVEFSFFKRWLIQTITPLTELPSVLSRAVFFKWNLCFVIVGDKDMKVQGMAAGCVLFIFSLELIWILKLFCILTTGYVECMSDVWFCSFLLLFLFFLSKEIFNSVFALWLLPALLVMKDQLLTFQRTYALLYAGNAFPKANRSSWVLNRELCSSKDTDRPKDVAALLMKNDVFHQLFSVIS